MVRANKAIALGAGCYYLEEMRLHALVRIVPRNFLPAGLLWLGAALLATSGILTITLMLWTNDEQAQAPGEKSLGVAALGLLLGLPAVVFAVGGLICLIAGCLVVAYRKIKASPH